MRIPVTDAFDDTDELESLEVKLSTQQIEWLQKKADERDLSLDHVLRSVLTAQMRLQSKQREEPPAPSISGDGEPARSTDDTAEEASDDNPSSIVESLRSASERLQDLTEQNDDDETPDPHDTLERLQARLGNTPDAEEQTEEDQDSYLVENKNRSMFEMMDDG